MLHPFIGGRIGKRALDLSQLPCSGVIFGTEGKRIVTKFANAQIVISEVFAIALNDLFGDP